MLLSRHLLSAVLFLVGVIQLAVATPLALSLADQRCLYTSMPASESTPLRSCRTCLNADLANPTCFLDSRGLCRAMSSYDFAPQVAENVYQFVAANTSYCPVSDATCTQCLKAGPESGVCTGADGACVCVAACESATWQNNVRAMIHTSAASLVATTPLPALLVTYEPTHTSPAVVTLGLVACVVVVALLVTTVRRRWLKKQGAEQSAFAYNIALTPTTKLPAKTVDGRV